jgi:hypothetical protein
MSRVSIGPRHFAPAVADGWPRLPVTRSVLGPRRGSAKHGFDPSAQRPIGFTLEPEPEAASRTT